MESLTAEAIQTFVAGLSGLSDREVGKAKQLYVRNAISEFNALVEEHRAFTIAGAIHWLIPLFWPFWFSHRKSVKAQERLAQERIENAMAVWHDDLDGLRVTFKDRRATIH